MTTWKKQEANMIFQYKCLDHDSPEILINDVLTGQG